MPSPGLAILGLDTSKMTDEEVADAVRLLTEELNSRKNRIKGRNWLDTQLKTSALETRSWTRSHRERMLRCFN